MVNDDVVIRCEELLVGIKKGDPGARKQMSQLFPSLQNAADSGRPDAQALVGGLALEHINDTAATLRYFRMSAEAGYPAGQRGLGHMLANGIGVERDISQAAMFFEAAVEAGDMIAAFNLGNMLLMGVGVAADETRAVELLSKAVAAGIPAAAASLGDWHTDREEYEQARKLYLAAANAGISKVMLTLGRWCSEGVGGPVDKVEAVRWLLKSLDFGDGDGVHEAIEIAQTMTDAEIRKAAVLAGREADAESLIGVVRGSS